MSSPPLFSYCPFFFWLSTAILDQVPPDGARLLGSSCSGDPLTAKPSSALHLRGVQSLRRVRILGATRARFLVRCARDEHKDPDRTSGCGLSAVSETLGQSVSSRGARGASGERGGLVALPFSLTGETFALFAGSPS